MTVWLPETGTEEAPLRFCGGVGLPFLPISQAWLNTIFKVSDTPRKWPLWEPFPNPPYVLSEFAGGKKINFENNEVIFK